MSLIGRGLAVFGALGIGAYTAYSSVQREFDNTFLPFRERIKSASDFFGSITVPEKRKAVGFRGNGASESTEKEENNAPNTKVRDPSFENDLEKSKINMEKKMEQLRKEREEIERSIKVLQQTEVSGNAKSEKSSIVELYSRLLDTLNSPDLKLQSQDIMPRIVVVGDQSAGKTSVLEMFAEARIFPRGSGEMMTRSPIQVTLTGGDERIAHFKDEKQIYRLDNEEDLTKLRFDIESKMKSSIKKGEAVSDTVISLTVRGSRHRIVLVDLPGVIGSVTAGMSPTTKGDIYRMSRSFINNPNAIILCIQDGSVDAERSNITDLVNEADPKGERTIFVLTKVDLAEKAIRADRIKQILDGKLFGMKALGYFAVITGTGNSSDTIASIRRYEQEYFKSSSLVKDKILSPSQVSMNNLSEAITMIFWKQVRRSTDLQLVAISRELLKCEKEYELMFGNRVISRDDAFGVSRTAILSKIHSSDALKATAMEQNFSKKVWDMVAKQFFEDFYFQSFVQSESYKEFLVSMETNLSNWPRDGLSDTSMNAGKQALLDSLRNLSPGKADFPEDESPAEALWQSVFSKVQETLKWSPRTRDSLISIQSSTLKEDIASKIDWDEGVSFMQAKIVEYIGIIKEENRAMFSPSWGRKFRKQEYTSLEQEVNSVLLKDCRNLFKKEGIKVKLGTGELALLKKSVRIKYGMDVTDEQVLKVFHYAQKLEFLRLSAKSAKHCAKSYSKESVQSKAPNQLECKDVVLFLRACHTMDATGKTLRVKIFDLKDVFDRSVRLELDKIGANPNEKKRVMHCERVDKGENIRLLRSVKQQLMDFIQELKKDKSV